MYQVNSDLRGEETVSEATTPEGTPMVTLKHNQISVMSFELLESILKASGDRKINETRACLESECIE